jgi:hypothetical protein
VFSVWPAWQIRAGCSEVVVRISLFLVDCAMPITSTSPSCSNIDVLGISKIATTVHDIASNVILGRGSLARPARPRGAGVDPLLHASTGLPALARLWEVILVI